MGKSLPHEHGSLPEALELPRDTFQSVSELMKLLSDSTRLEIFWLLCHGEECVVNISALLEMSPPAVSHHLKLLKTAGLVISRREGKEVYYTAPRTPRTEVLHKTAESLVELTCPSEAAFEAHPDYASSVETANQVHSLLTQDLRKRYTIEELAQRFHINQTTLKAVFKQVFGKPIAGYIKEYRIRRAMELLQSGSAIWEVARAVGYESQSKFTQAFKEITGQLPKDYRKHYGG